MSLTLIKEDGTGKADANIYASVADADAYHAGHLYASAWTGATADNKAAALVMASRLIDAEYQFGGMKATSGQALQWPRADCRDPDTGEVVPENTVPKALPDATCELARELLIADRTVAPPGEGQKYFNNGGVQTGYDKSDTRPVIPKLVQAMLAKFGSRTKARSGTVKLIRV
jgi:hypothetical protein